MDPIAPETTDTSVTPPVPSGAEPVVTATPPPLPKLSTGYAKLAREQREFKAQAEKFEADRKSFEAEKSATSEKWQIYEAAKAEAKRNPIKFLEAHGLTYQDLVESQLNDGQPTANLEVKAVKDEVAALRAETESKEKKAAEDRAAQTKAQEQRVLANFRADCVAQVKAGGEIYELTNLYNAHDRVPALIEAHYAQQIKEGVAPPVILSLKEAAEAVEYALEEEAKKIAKSKKIAKFLAPPAPPTAPKKISLEKKHDVSLSNKLTQVTTAPSSGKLTRQQREERALAALSRF